MAFPDIIVAGTAKAGTTSVFQLLKQHPSIFPCRIKEPRYFANLGEELDRWSEQVDPADEIVHDNAHYKQLFNGASEDQLTLEASPNYLYSEAAASEIRKHSPDCRLIFILRNPIDRAFSHYSHLKRDQREPLPSFSKALAAEKQRIEQNYDFSFHYAAMGKYAEQLKRYYDIFPKTQIKTIDYERLSSEPEEVLTEIFRFLSLPVHPIDCRKRHNVSHQPQESLLLKSIMSDFPVKSKIKDLIPRGVRSHLKTVATATPRPSKADVQTLRNNFYSDTIELSKLVDWDLSHWGIL